MKDVRKNLIIEAANGKIYRNCCISRNKAGNYNIYSPEGDLISEKEWKKVELTDSNHIIAKDLNNKYWLFFMKNRQLINIFNGAKAIKKVLEEFFVITDEKGRKALYESQKCICD